MEGASWINRHLEVLPGQICEVCSQPATTPIKVGNSRIYVACNDENCHCELRQRARADICRKSYS